MSEPTEPAAIPCAEAGPHTGFLIPVLVRFWTHVLCALLVPALAIGAVVAWSEWRECIGGAHAGYTALRGFSATCIEPTPVVEPNAAKWWYDDSDVYTEHRLHQSVIVDTPSDLSLTLNGSYVAVSGESQLRLGKTDAYPSAVKCGKENEGALLYFKSVRQARICNGYAWRNL